MPIWVNLVNLWLITLYNVYFGKKWVNLETPTGYYLGGRGCTEIQYMTFWRENTYVSLDAYIGENKDFPAS